MRKPKKKNKKEVDWVPLYQNALRRRLEDRSLENKREKDKGKCPISVLLISPLLHRVCMLLTADGIALPIKNTQNLTSNPKSAATLSL